MILKLFRRSSPAHSIRDLYGAIVAQAREPAFYSIYGVPDSVQGRFDLIVLHLVLVLAQIGREAGEQALPQALPNLGAARAIGQQLFDTFCRDLDDNLREMGVGDLAVPKKMRGFAEAFYGRQAAYVAALAATDRRELENALARNIFDGARAGEGAVRLAAYVRAALAQFGQQGHSAFEAALLRGRVEFPKPEIMPIAEAVKNG
ncbi:MAG: ubiquinol-cytochrome C chaperone family protein [Xanthobacteraceae bacterium]